MKKYTKRLLIFLIVAIFASLAIMAHADVIGTDIDSLEATYSNATITVQANGSTGYYSDDVCEAEPGSKECNADVNAGFGVERQSDGVNMGYGPFQYTPPAGNGRWFYDGSINTCGWPNGNYIVFFHALGGAQAFTPERGISPQQDETLVTLSGNPACPTPTPSATPSPLPRLDLTKIQSTFSYPTNSDTFGVMNVQNQGTTSMNWVGSKNVAWINPLSGTAAGGSGLGNGQIASPTSSFTVDPAQALIGVNDGIITESCNPASSCDPGYQTRDLGVRYTIPGPSVTLSSNPATPVAAGTSVTLSWTGTNCNTTSPVYSSNFGGPNQCSGSQVVNPNATTTYTITIKGLSNGDTSPANFATASVTVTVAAIPTVTLQGYSTAGSYVDGPISISSGGLVNLKWIVSGDATSCTASGGWSGAKAFANGDHYATPAATNVTTNTIYTLTCTNAAGSSNDSFDVRVLSATLSASPSSGTMPLNNVSLTTNVSGTSSGTYRYFLDCTNDGTNEQDVTNSSNPYTANNLCNYPINGTYTAKATVWHNESIATATTTITVNVPANQPPTASNVTVSNNYCVTAPTTSVVSWTYSDPDNHPQSAYQVQVNGPGSSFNPPLDYDSGKVISSGTSHTVTGLPLGQSSTKARVKVWDANDLASSWSAISNPWNVPNNAYPFVDFCWPENCNAPTAGPRPKPNIPVQFTDRTIFYDGGGNRDWAWTFGDGGNSSQQNPTHTYSSTGPYTVTLTAEDDDNQSCSISKQVNVQRVIPIWREISPGL